MRRARRCAVAGTKSRSNPARKGAQAPAGKAAPAMFGEISNPSIQVGARKWYTLPLSIIAHVVAIGAVVIVPLMAMDALPTPASMMAFVAAPPPAAEAAEAARSAVRRPRSAT